jgi:hypothetical protein
VRRLAVRASTAVAVASVVVGLGVDIASWGWLAAPALLLPAGLCAAGVAVYFRGRSRELWSDDQATVDDRAWASVPESRRSSLKNA